MDESSWHSQCRHSVASLQRTAARADLEVRPRPTVKSAIRGKHPCKSSLDATAPSPLQRNGIAPAAPRRGKQQAHPGRTGARGESEHVELTRCTKGGFSCPDPG